MTDDDRPIGYKNPPTHSQFQKGQSGNPSGRPKKVPDFLEDAAVILNAPVTGRVNGEKITLPAAQAMFRRMCQNALKGDNAALHRIIDLMLILEPVAQQQAEQEAKLYSGAKQKLAMALGIDLDNIDDRPEAPDPERKKLEKQADAMAREERKRLIREAKKRQHTR